MDLSAPSGHSINDGMQKELSSLAYISVDDVIAEILRREMGIKLAKMDIKQTYRNFPVHPKDRHLLGMHWKGEVFVDATLPLALRSAPLLFTAVVDALQWIMQKKGLTWVGHYIDDFITMGSPGCGECKTKISITKETYTDLMNLKRMKDQQPQ